MGTIFRYQRPWLLFLDGVSCKVESKISLSIWETPGGRHRGYTRTGSRLSGGPTRVHLFPLVPPGPHAPCGAGHRTIGARRTADGTKRMSTRWRSSSARVSAAAAATGQLELRGQLADQVMHLAGEPSASASAARRAVCATESVRPRSPEAPASAPQSCVEARPGRAAGGTRLWRHPAPAPAGRTAPSPATATRPAGPRSRRAGAAQGGQQRRATFKVKLPRPGPGGSGSGAAACAGAGGARPAAPGPSCQSESADSTGQGQRGPAAGRASQRSPAGGSAPLCCAWPKGGNLPECLEGRNIKG